MRGWGYGLGICMPYLFFFRFICYFCGNWTRFRSLVYLKICELSCYFNFLQFALIWLRMVCWLVISQKSLLCNPPSPLPPFPLPPSPNLSPFSFSVLLFVCLFLQFSMRIPFRLMFFQGFFFSLYTQNWFSGTYGTVLFSSFFEC